jgi:glycosyltransferase involved in cell wall biosynthesis
MRKGKLAIITSHPIQYNAPFFRLLAERNRILVKVFYTWGASVGDKKYDPGFNKVVQWDIPLLSGYEYEFLENTSPDGGTHHFRGILNPDIVERVDTFDPDAILIFGWAFQSHLKVLRHYRKKKLILFRGDSTLLDKPSFLKGQVRLLFLKWVYRHIDYALFVGKNNLEYFKMLGLRDAQLVSAPHAIDIQRFSEMGKLKQEEALDLRKSVGIGLNDMVFLFAGKLERKKSVDTLLAAFVKSGLFKASHLVVVGNGILENELKELYDKFDAIHFMDFQNQSQMPIIYRMADVFVLPSEGPGETWGLSVNEAMACGLPVLVSNRCGCAIDLVWYGKNGYIFNAGDMNDLCEKLEMLLILGKAGLKKMGACSREKIEGFSFEKICEAIEGILSNDQVIRELTV